ncbi:putative Methyltransferase FkbM family [groundwater metagenome]|uniref:Putative Methyltransferase FkbM family n=1 Tax=groundwater metagenome TaxID=717931 RepID=A0A098E9E3_9ZZZZ
MFFVKQIIRRMLLNRTINQFARQIIKPVFKIIPDKFVYNLGMTVVGRFSVELPDGKYLIMESDGGDGVANVLGWAGFRGYEYETTKIFYDLVSTKKVDVFFDVGANTGYYTLLAGVANNKCQVLAFEPVLQGFSYLKRNILLNNLSNATAICSAVTNFDGDVELYVPQCEDEGVPVSATTSKDFSVLETKITVPAITLDFFVNKNKIYKVDLIKIDTERTEHNVIRGSKNIIKQYKPIIICEVLKGIQTERLLESLLSDLGYKYYWITDKWLIKCDNIKCDSTLKFVNYLFCNKEKQNIISKYITK